MHGNNTIQVMLYTRWGFNSFVITIIYFCNILIEFMIIPANWKEWLIFWKVGLTFRGIQRSWRNGPTITSWSLTGQALDPVFKWSLPTDQDRLGLSGSSAGKNLESWEDRRYKGSALHSCLKEDQPHTGLHWQRQWPAGQGVWFFSSLVSWHLKYYVQFWPPRTWHFLTNWRGTKRVQGLEPVMCRKMLREQPILDWEKMAERGLAAALHYLKRDYREDAWSHFSEVNKEQDVVASNCRKQGPSWMKGRVFSNPISRQAVE